MRWLDGITNLMDVNLSEHQEMVMDRGAWQVAVVSNSLQPHGLQHARPPCLLPTLGAYTNACQLNQL